MKYLTKHTIALLLVTVLSLGGCAQPASESIPEQPIEEAASLQTEEEILKGMDKDFLGLTKEQRLADFDYLYRTLEENYPYFGVVKRKAGVDLPIAYTETRAFIESCENDYEYTMLVKQFIDDMDYIGHISMWHPDYFFYELEDYRELMEDEEYREYATPFYHLLNNEPAISGNHALQNFLYELEEQKTAINSSDEPGEAIESSNAVSNSNVVPTILEDGRVAYVAIHSFPMIYEEDQAVLLPFYQEIQAYDHLIIDITENGGGSMGYYNELILRPLMKEPLEVPIYILFKDGALNREWFLADDFDTNSLPTSQFPKLPAVNLEDLEENTHFEPGVYSFTPAEDGIAFQGHVWLLVSGNNYSSSEYAAMFSKHSGFATLVGENTGGDGIGTQPIPFTLPYSGYVIQYAPIHGLTADGRGSEEFGTQPDIYQKPDETALDACLRAIENLEN